MEIPICERFLSFQGEGCSVGRLAYFVRVQGCNLKCSFCDSKYALKAGGKKEHTEDIAEAYNIIPGDPLLVITGGEPLLYPRAVELILLQSHGAKEVETNGTIFPPDSLSDEVNTFNVSPKLASSGVPGKLAIKKYILEFFNERVGKSIFKFVIKTREDWQQMEAIIKDVQIDPGDVWVMPEGKTPDKIRTGSLKWIDEIKAHGYNLSPRYHVMLYGNKRGI